MAQTIEASRPDQFVVIGFAENLVRFPMPAIPLAGTGMHVKSTDDNFYYVHSQAADDLVHRSIYRKQMLDSYLNYFNDNYYGRRAPVFISHHFADYQGGAYWEALQDFTKSVCRQPEVQCVSFAQFEQSLELQKEAYGSGNFMMKQRPKFLKYEPAKALDIHLQILKTGDELRIIPSGADYSEDSMKLIVKINNQPVNFSLASPTISLASLHKQLPIFSSAEISASLVNRKGWEVQRVTHWLHNLGSSEEKLIENSQEMRSLQGDWPEVFQSY
ncbi:MAG TPA: hypothetical protein VN132_08585 [Bdellovibrio sp.]|nr:hypothetical protein [Bdellovibrio sp.]